MKKTKFNNIEESKLVLGYIYYLNNKNKIVSKKALAYSVPEEDLIFCISSHEFQINQIDIQQLMYERVEENNNLYISIDNDTIFEYKKHIYPESNRKISMEELTELTPLLGKYMIDENFNDENNYTNRKKEVKQIIFKKSLFI